MEIQFSLHELLADKQEGESIIQASQSLKSLVDKRDSLNLDRAEAGSCPTWQLPEAQNMIKAAQLRLHKEKVLAIEGMKTHAGYRPGTSRKCFI